MTFEQIWNQLVKKNVSLSRGDAIVEFRADNLRHLLRQVYEQGEKQGIESVPKQASSDGLFGDIFGNLGKWKH